MSKLVLIRHGQSIWNSENRFTGWVDVDLSEKGVKEAETAGLLLKSENILFDFYYTSLLKRASRTLEIILQKIGEKRKFTKAWELNERHYGSLTGLNKDEMRKKLGEKQFKLYRRSWDIPPPELDENSEFSSYKDPLFKDLKVNQIPKTESLKNTFERAVPFYLNNIQPLLKNKKNVLISAHGNSLRAICKKIFSISDKDINSLEIPTGNPMLIETENGIDIKEKKYLDSNRAKKI